MSTHGSDLANVRGLLRGGESPTVEFRSRFMNQVALGRDISAFANTDGGHLFFGVDDAGVPFGMSTTQARDVAERVRRVGDSMLERPIRVETYDIDGRLVVSAYIPPAERHLRPVKTASGEAFSRRGAKTVKWPERQERALPTKKRKAFVAMSFRSEEEPTLVDYFAAMQRAVRRTGLPVALVRMDLVAGDYEITQEIMNQIDSCDFVIADFTLSSHNVYLEVGYARGREKPVVRCARKGTELEFDVKTWHTLFYRNATELEEGLTAEIEAVYASLA